MTEFMESLFCSILILLLVGCTMNSSDAQKRIEASGLYVYDTGKVSQPYLSKEGKRLMVNGENVQVYEYKSEAAALKEKKKMFNSGINFKSTPYSTTPSTTFYQKDNEIIVYVGKKDSVKNVLVENYGEPFAVK